MIATSINRLGNDKACGPDEVPSALLKVGADAMGVKVHGLQQLVVQTERWPVAWKGGRLCDLYKKKGDPSVCKSHRGLTIMDHLANCFIDILKCEIQGPVNSALPVDQHGGVKGSGTDVASHMVGTLIDYAKVREERVWRAGT